MKFNFKWLQKLVPVTSTPAVLADKITNAGLEVESIANDLFDISIPPNRADCLGMLGIAREVAALENTTFTMPVVKAVPAASQDKISVQVQASKECPKYLARVIKGIDNTRETPQWIKECLQNAEMKLISPVVDITNYVLLEWGQPLHAFDLDKVNGNIVVRLAQADEELLLLDDTVAKLNKDTLVIADSMQPLAIAGIKGGKNSGIAIDTKDIVVECAYFEPIGIRLSSRNLGVKTDSSHRFERCIDPSMQETVLEHVTRLLLDIVGGVAGPVVAVKDDNYLPKTIALQLRLSHMQKILGLSIDMPTTISILQHLEFKVDTHNHDDILMVSVPGFRTDITREIDLVEEVARIYGFENIPAVGMVSTLEFKNLPESKLTERQVLSCLLNRGYHEAVTYSFIDFEYAKLFDNTANPELCLTNPISAEMNFMRSSLLPGLLKALQYNQNRQQERIRLFEIGLCFSGNSQNLLQSKMLAGVCYGNYLAKNWSNQKRWVDLFDIKGDVLALFALALNKDITFKAATDVAMHPGQCLEVLLHDRTIGKVGALHPQIQQLLGLPGAVFMFELNYTALVSGNSANFNIFSKYPAIRRDIAVLVDRKLTAANLEHAIREQVGSLLQDLVLFDVYQGKGVADHQKSMALSLTLQHPERTLTDVEINDIFANLLDTLQSKFNATLR